MAKKLQSQRQKRVPQRTCVVCRQKRDKRTLTRLVAVKDDDGGEYAGITIDPTGKMNGRGAYLCEQSTCWHKAAKTAALSQALRVQLTDSDRNLIVKAFSEKQIIG